MTIRVPWPGALSTLMVPPEIHYEPANDGESRPVPLSFVV